MTYSESSRSLKTAPDMTYNVFGGTLNHSVNQSINHSFLMSLAVIKQVARLSQRDRAPGSVSYGQKWKTGTGRRYLRTL